MGRGLGHIQKALLQYFAELPEGGGEYAWGYWGGSGDLLYNFKVKQWPHLYGRKSPYFNKYGIPAKQGSEYNDNGTGLSKAEYQKQQNKVRVTIHNSVKSLLKRGLLRAVSENDNEILIGWTWLKEIYITDAGRELIINAVHSGQH